MSFSRLSKELHEWSFEDKKLRREEKFLDSKGGIIHFENYYLKDVDNEAEMNRAVRRVRNFVSRTQFSRGEKMHVLYHFEVKMRIRDLRNKMGLNEK